MLYYCTVLVFLGYALSSVVGSVASAGTAMRGSFEKAPAAAPADRDTWRRVTLHDERLSVNLKRSSLLAVLQEVAWQGGIRLSIRTSIDVEVASLKFDKLPLTQGLRRLLSGQSFVLFYLSSEPKAGQAPRVKLTEIRIYPNGEKDKAYRSQARHLVVDAPEKRTDIRARSSNHSWLAQSGGRRDVISSTLSTTNDLTYQERVLKRENPKAAEKSVSDSKRVNVGNELVKMREDNAETPRIVQNDEVIKALVQRPHGARKVEVSTSVVEFLIQRLQESDDVRVRINAVKALGKIGGPEVIEPLAGTLKDRDAVIRAIGANALAETGERDAIPYLEKAAQRDDDPDVRKNAVEALNSIR